MHTLLLLCVLLLLNTAGTAGKGDKDYENADLVDVGLKDFGKDKREIDTELSSATTRCIGLKANFDKMEDISTEDLNMIQNPTDDRMFSITSQTTVTRSDGKGPLTDRVRLKEFKKGIPIRGATSVVSFKPCTTFICATEVAGLQGKTFRDIDIPAGYASNATEDQVVEKLMDVFDTDAEGVGSLSLEVFAATNGDHLAYYTDVLVDKKGEVRYYSVIVDAHNLGVLSICDVVGVPQLQELEGRDIGINIDGKNDDSHDSKDPIKHNKPPKRYLRALQEEVETISSATGISCESCAGNSSGVTWSTENENCPINSLYLNDTGRETTCVVGTTEDGDSVFGAGAVPSLHWEGTHDCKSTTNQCQPTVLPECSDAISDVQYGSIRTLEYFQEYLGIMGGLGPSDRDPIPVKANVHYNSRFCNAFYRFSSNTVFFGDCDCSFWTPLTSIDIVAHEIAHGVTKHSSGLEYQYQSGGMNEGFSDIVGAVLEFLIDDSIDKPDFIVGEMLGNRLRSMKNPAERGASIESVCDYQSDMSVHHTSGPLNLAFVNAVQQCELSGCGNKKECVVLLGTIFMYANIQVLTSYSGYLDGATATCGIVDEYYTAKSPDTTCSAESVTTFIRQGWSTVNITLDETCKATNCCTGDCPIIPPVPDILPDVEGSTSNTTSEPLASPPPTAAPVVVPAPTPAPVPSIQFEPQGSTRTPTSIPPTTPFPTTTPVPVPVPATAVPTPGPEMEGDQSVLRRIYKYVQGLFQTSPGRLLNGDDCT